jgi:hypothetical protein
MLFELVPAPVHVAGDPLGRSYTPEHVARAIAERLIQTYGMPRVVLEPCVGGGAFVRPFLGRAMCIGVDLDPNAPGLALVDDPIVGDAAGIDWTPDFADLALTNPPFGRAVGQETTLAIATRSIRAADTCALLVPLDYLTQVGWAALVADCAEVWPFVGRVWDHERGMVVLVWHVHHEGPTLHRPLPVRS